MITALIALKRRPPHQAAQDFDLLPQRITNLPHDFTSFGSRNLDEGREDLEKDSES